MGLRCDPRGSVGLGGAESFSRFLLWELSFYGTTHTILTKFSEGFNKSNFTRRLKYGNNQALENDVMDILKKEFIKRLPAGTCEIMKRDAGVLKTRRSSNHNVFNKLLVSF